ncbi:MAG TPA: glycosyltransferase family 4 protein [Edaphobacter sp.]|nr:glycosyltransferase family 4 protein [Edaphobacter sp.]
MTVAYVISQYPAASHTFIRREIEALRLGGVDIQTFSVRHPMASELHSLPDRVEADNTYYLLPTKLKDLLAAHVVALATRPISYVRVLLIALRHRVPGLRALIWAVFHFAEAIQLSRELECRKVRRIHNHFANSGATVGMLAAQFLQLPWSLTLHGISETDYPAGLLLGAKIEVASFVACVSEFGRAQAMRVSLPEHWNKIIIVRCALNFADLPKRPININKRTRLICVARLSAEKGHLGLLNAFANVRARNLDAELVLVGDGPERMKIQEAIQTLNLQDVVHLTGVLAEKETLEQIAHADILVLASFMEGLPVVLMEALAIGVPVVATRVAGIPELVAHEKDGLLFSPANWDELAENLSRLLSDSALRNRLAGAGRSKVFSNHNIETAFKPLFSKYIEGAAINFADAARDIRTDRRPRRRV